MWHMIEKAGGMKKMMRKMKKGKGKGKWGKGKKGMRGGRRGNMMEDMLKMDGSMIVMREDTKGNSMLIIKQGATAMAASLSAASLAALTLY